MITISPTPSYALDLPDSIQEDQDERVTSFWMTGSALALQLSSYFRMEGEQISAEERLRDRIAKEYPGTWKRWPVEARKDQAGQASAITSDSSGLCWIHTYICWADLCVYATISGPSQEIVDLELNWAASAMASIRRIGHYCDPA